MWNDTEDGVFDKFLLEGKADEAYEWAAEEVNKAPWNLNLRGQLAFSTFITGEKKRPLELANEVLRFTLTNEWALATMFGLVCDRGYREAFETFEGYRKLDVIWVFRFSLLGYPKAASTLCRCLMLKGTQAQRKKLKRDLLNYYCGDEVY